MGGSRTAHTWRSRRKGLETWRWSIRYATLVAILIESQSTLIDEIVDMHDRIIGTLFNRAKHNHAEKFQSSGRSINEKVRLYWRIGRALLEAKSNGTNPFEALEAIIPWEDFTKSIEEAQKLSQDEDFDYLYQIGNGYSQVRRYAPVFLDSLVFKATPSAQELLNGVEVIKKLNDTDTRSIPEDAPTGFIRKRWQNLIFVNGTIDRRFYELCVLTELK
jgi:hypothetical protein